MITCFGLKYMILHDILLINSGIHKKLKNSCKARCRIYCRHGD